MQTVNIWTWARTHQWRIQGKNRGWGGGGGGGGGVMTGLSGPSLLYQSGKVMNI